MSAELPQGTALPTSVLLLPKRDVGETAPSEATLDFCFLKQLSAVPLTLSHSLTPSHFQASLFLFAF